MVGAGVGFIVGVTVGLAVGIIGMQHNVVEG